MGVINLPKLIFLGVLASWAVAEWCYNEKSCEPDTWSRLGFCGGNRQSPLDINESAVVRNSSLGSFQFTGYDNATLLLSIKNLGHTVEVALDDGVSISGGGLNTEYSAIAFHFHWGNGTSSPGSEHRLSGKQFPMEMHIVHTINKLNLSESRKNSTGIAVLAFFINVAENTSFSSNLSTLSNLLQQVSTAGLLVPLNATISINSLLGQVDRTSYYRYLGSLTTPTCDEAVIWTVFKNPILVPASVINTFPEQLYFNGSDELQMLANNFRPLQKIGSRLVHSSMSATPTAIVSTTKHTTVSITNHTPSSIHTKQILIPSTVLAIMCFLYTEASLTC
uniref:Carbonic anhydrase n=1 Tax=Geotrypetes seraphini TaxID=260995 RepID=A0A6P8QQM1_GEOSA|nr:carbonic anhydrase 4-like isoform X2 [Geotrypetes seraphini]XP_033800682.1 carbonic anhydrase 4-like isoform X2 [Geotrypetes seraphini]